MAEASGLMRGKRGLILGVANNRSLAWGIARACRAQGAEVGLTYQGDALKKRVEPLAQEIGAQRARPLRRDRARDHRRGVRGRAEGLGHARFRGARRSPSPTRTSSTAATSTPRRTISAGRMLISCYSFAAIAQRAEKLMPHGGSLLTLTYYGAEKWIPHYNVMGVAKAALEASVRYLAADLGTKKIRVNAISSGPDQDAGGRGHRRLPLYPRLDRAQRAAAAQRHDRGGGRRGGLSAVRHVARRHRARSFMSMPATTSSA